MTRVIHDARFLSGPSPITLLLCACAADDEEDTKEEFDPEVYFMREVSATVLRAIKERIDEVRGQGLGRQGEGA